MTPIKGTLGGLQERGAVLVETILVLPILILLLAGAAEFGNAFWQYSALTKTVRDAARFAASSGLVGSSGLVVLTPALRADVGNMVVYGNISGSGQPRLTGLVTSDVAITSPGDDDIIVTVTYNYDAIFGVIPAFYGAVNPTPLSMSAAVQMRAL